MRQQKTTIFNINGRNKEIYATKFKADNRSENWQPPLLLASTKLLAYKQEYLRTAAKELAKMSANGVLVMPKIVVIRDNIKMGAEKEFIVPECIDEVLEILEALVNTYGTDSTI